MTLHLLSTYSCLFPEALVSKSLPPGSTAMGKALHCFYTSCCFPLFHLLKAQDFKTRAIFKISCLKVKTSILPGIPRNSFWN